jgi:hypothetical protein
MATSRVDDPPSGLTLPQVDERSRESASCVVDLRKLLAERFPQPVSLPPARLRTGLAAIDQQLSGGLPKSAITEILSPQVSGGSALLISALIHAAYQGGYFIALVDGQNSFDPQPLGNRLLRNLLWIRCQDAIEAVKAADLLLRDGNFPLVLVDLVLNPGEQLRKIPQTSWYRLQRLVEPSATAFVVLTRRSMISSAQLKVVIENSWSLEHLETNGSELLSCLRLRVQRGHLGNDMVELKIAS